MTGFLFMDPKYILPLFRKFHNWSSVRLDFPARWWYFRLQICLFLGFISYLLFLLSSQSISSLSMKIWFCYYLVWNFGNKTQSSLFYVNSSFLCFSIVFWSTFYLLLTVREWAGGVHSLTVGVYNCCFDLKTSFKFFNIF